MGKRKDKKKNRKGQAKTMAKAQAANPAASDGLVYSGRWGIQGQDEPQGIREGAGETPDSGLLKMQEWVKVSGAKVCVLFEGRDAAGKGGIIKRITELYEPPCLPVGSPSVANRAGEDPDVRAALYSAPAGGRRGCFLRLQRVQQPGGCRAGYGIHPGGRGGKVPESGSPWFYTP